MSRLSFLLFAVSLCLINHTESAPSLDQDNDALLVKFDETLDKMADAMQKISASVDEQGPQVCDKPLDKLENSNTDWNVDATYVHNDIVTITCNEGYNTKGNVTVQTVKCLLGNEWSIFNPCKESCSKVIDLKLNTRPEFALDEVYLVGDKVVIACEEGSRTENNEFKQTATCETGDKWSSFEACTKPTCSKPLEGIENANTDWTSDGIYSPDDKVLITCKTGYRTKERTAKQSATCLPDNMWTSFEPCQEICPQPFTQHGEICVFASSETETWRTARKSCSSMKEDYDCSLAIMSSEETQRDFISYVNESNIATGRAYWVAAHDFFEEGWHVWNDASEVSSLYSGFNWEAGQPDNMDGEEHCLAFSTDGLQDDNCDDNNRYLCFIKM